MIDLYTYQTSNGQRAAIMLEECGFPYRVHKIDLVKGEQQHPDYLAKNPIGAIPTIVDPQGPGGRPLTLTQSGAIALYLAEKAGRFVPTDPEQRVTTMQWLMVFQVATQNATGELGPPSARAQNFSLLALGYSISGFVGPLVAGFAIDHLGFAATFALLAAIPFIPLFALRSPRLALPGARPHEGPRHHVMEAARIAGFVHITFATQSPVK